MLCIDYPSEILTGILRLLDKREDENVEFDEFLCVGDFKCEMLCDRFH